MASGSTTGDGHLRHPEKARRPDNPVHHKPAWIRVKAPTHPVYRETRALMRENRLVNVCEEAACPNIGECWSQRRATMMIMGGICTRACSCGSDPGLAAGPDLMLGVWASWIEATSKAGRGMLAGAGEDNCLAMRKAARHVSQLYDRCLAPAGLKDAPSPSNS